MTRHPNAHHRIAILVAGVIGAACNSAESANTQAITDAERAALADTIDRLYRRTDAAVDSLSCSELTGPGALPIVSPFLYVIEGQFIELSAEQWAAACEQMVQGRLSAHNEIHDQRVHVLNRDGAFVVSRSTYTIRWKDGRTTSQPRVTTTVWSRRPEGWRQEHLHESWPDSQQPKRP
jgi:hypothetical protein